MACCRAHAASVGPGAMDMLEEFVYLRPSSMVSTQREASRQPEELISWARVLEAKLQTPAPNFYLQIIRNVFLCSRCGLGPTNGLHGDWLAVQSADESIMIIFEIRDVKKSSWIRSTFVFAKEIDYSVNEKREMLDSFVISFILSIKKFIVEDYSSQVNHPNSWLFLTSLMVR